MAIKNEPEIRKELEQLDASCGGKLTPELVVSTAKKSSGALGEWIAQWSEKTASRLFYIQQAKKLLHRYKMYVLRRKVGGTGPVIVYNVDKKGEGKNEPVEETEIKSNFDLKRQLINRRLDELRAWLKRSQDYLPELCNRISSVMKEMNMSVSFDKTDKGGAAAQ